MPEISGCRRRLAYWPARSQAPPFAPRRASPPLPPTSPIKGTAGACSCQPPFHGSTFLERVRLHLIPIRKIAHVCGPSGRKCLSDLLVRRRREHSAPGFGKGHFDLCVRPRRAAALPPEAAAISGGGFGIPLALSRRGRHETSTSTVSAPGSGCCRAPGRIAHREGAVLSDAAHFNDCAVSCRGPDRCGRTHHGRADEGRARTARHCRECYRRWRQLGAGKVARAAPDGYTLSVGNWNSHVANGATYALQYDVVTDFEPVALLTSAPLWIVARKSMPAANLQELVAWLKANPDKASAGTAGIGTAAHLCGLYFQHNTGTRFQLVPYRGGPRRIRI